MLGLRPAQIPRRRSIQANPDATLIDIDIDVARYGMIHPPTGGRRGVAEPITINHLNIIDMKIETKANDTAFSVENKINQYINDNDVQAL